MTYLFHKSEKYPYVDKLTVMLRRFLIAICLIERELYMYSWKSLFILYNYFLTTKSRASTMYGISLVNSLCRGSNEACFHVEPQG
jgi:hypothetical protein